MPVKDLVAITAITHKPKTKVEHVAPGETFTPANDDEREFFLKARAARELAEGEAPAKKTAAKKTAAKKTEAPAPAEEKGVPMDSEPGDTGTAGTTPDLLD